MQTALVMLLQWYTKFENGNRSPAIKNIAIIEVSIK